MELRMLPIKEVFDRFPRMVRGLAEEIGKKVNLNIREKIRSLTVQ